MDEDLPSMTREQLMDEVRKLRQGIREHRDSSLHELCWHHPQRGCVRYRESLDRQLANAPRSNEPFRG